MKLIKNLSIYHLMAFHALTSVLVIGLFDGTSDAGDSIGHYLFAKYAPEHPRLFFNHWAKPVYVLLFSPFAQFGFVGVKVFNAVLANLTLLYTYRVTRDLGLKKSILAPFFILFSPMYFITTYSGLTDILFGFILILSIYLVMKKKFLLTAVIISFLPFVRSEGLIMLGIFGLYFLLKGQWKLLPLFLLGHIVYSIAGYSTYDDILWVFTKVPYLNLQDHYGSGEPFHFVENLIYVVGIPIFVFVWLGFLRVPFQWKSKTLSQEMLVLVFLGFTSFTLAHSLFWYLGIFNSMGLMRVMIGVMPLIAILALNGFALLSKLKAPYDKALAAAFLVYIIVFPFSGNNASVKWDSDLSLNADQLIVRRVAERLIAENKNLDRLIYLHPYLSLSLNWDQFDREKYMELSKPALNELRIGDHIIWENWFAVVERDVRKEALQANDRLKLVFEMDTTANGRFIEYAVFEVVE